MIVSLRAGCNSAGATRVPFPYSGQ